MTSPELHLTVGLPGTGKTTLARRLAQDLPALRLTPDEWMAPLFGESSAGGSRDVLEGRFLWLAHEALRCGTSVVLDLGCWSAEERWAVRAVAEASGGRFRMHALELPEDERRRRCRARWAETPHETFPMDDAAQDRFVELFRAPDAAELAGDRPPAAPAPAEDWLHWAALRWPTFPRLDLAS